MSVLAFIIGIIATLVGLASMTVKKERFENALRAQNEKKRQEIHTEKNIALRFKVMRIAGPVALLAGLVLIALEIAELLL